MAKDETLTIIANAEKALVKLRNKLKRVDLNYTVQVSVNSTQPTKISYAAQMSPPAEGLAPVTFIADTGDELIEKIKEATKHIDYGEVEKAYHQAQIQACERTIEVHKQRLTDIDAEQNPTEEAPAVPPENGSEVAVEGEVTPAEEKSEDVSTS